MGQRKENQESEDDAAVNKQGSREPIYVLTSDKNSLYLTATDVYMNDCYNRYTYRRPGDFIFLQTEYCTALLRTAMENLGLEIPTAI